PRSSGDHGGRHAPRSIRHLTPNYPSPHMCVVSDHTVLRQALPRRSHISLIASCLFMCLQACTAIPSELVPAVAHACPRPDCRVKHRASNDVHELRTISRTGPRTFGGAAVLVSYSP